MARFSASAFCAAFLGLCLCAASAPRAEADTQAIRASNNSVWISAGGSLLNYKEPTTAPNLPDSERGWTSSVAAGASMLGRGDAPGLARNLYLALETEGDFGDVHYNGAYFNSPTTPLTGTTTESIWTIDGKIGRAFTVDSSLMLTPYLELGYRYWDRQLSSIQDEKYQHIDTLGGLMVQLAPTRRLVLTGYGSAGTTFSAKMDTGGNTYNLADSAIYKAGGKIGYDLTPQTEVFTTLDYTYFRYGQSPVVAGAYEPNSHTESTAVRVGIGYHFQ
ncbi:MAG: hypothetical protein KGI97_03805 [Alphaproteobacteria bacterium]|nr:hypothetical protein [Alphaproteobacteria bacterium]